VHLYLWLSILNLSRSIGTRLDGATSILVRGEVDAIRRQKPHCQKKDGTSMVVLKGIVNEVIRIWVILILTETKLASLIPLEG
jgi:hypothetical protein